MSTTTQQSNMQKQLSELIYGAILYPTPKSSKQLASFLMETFGGNSPSVNVGVMQPVTPETGTTVLSSSLLALGDQLEALDTLTNKLTRSKEILQELYNHVVDGVNGLTVQENLDSVKCCDHWTETYRHDHSQSCINYSSNLTALIIDPIPELRRVVKDNPQA